MTEETQKPMELPECISKRLGQWKSLYIWHTQIHYSLGIIGIFASTIAALSIQNHKISSAAGVVSAVVFGVIGFVRPEQKYTKFVSAWRILDSAASKYRYKLLSLEDLLTAKERGEDIISGYERTEALSRPKKQSHDQKA